MLELPIMSLIVEPISEFAALTVYDMCKALDKGIEIREIVLDHKSGGKSGNYSRVRKKT